MMTSSHKRSPFEASSKGGVSGGAPPRSPFEAPSKPLRSQEQEQEQEQERSSESPSETCPKLQNSTSQVQVKTLGAPPPAPPRLCLRQGPAGPLPLTRCARASGARKSNSPSNPFLVLTLPPTRLCSKKCLRTKIWKRKRRSRALFQPCFELGGRSKPKKRGEGRALINLTASSLPDPAPGGECIGGASTGFCGR